jgi:hypothetical protein
MVTGGAFTSGRHEPLWLRTQQQPSTVLRILISNKRPDRAVTPTHALTVSDKVSSLP